MRHIGTAWERAIAPTMEISAKKTIVECLKKSAGPIILVKACPIKRSMAVVITVAIMAATTAAPQAPPFRIMVAVPPVATPAAPPPIAFDAGMEEMETPAVVAAGHPAERRIRQPVLQGIGIMPAVKVVLVFTPIAERKEAARSDAQGVVGVGAAAGHPAATHTRQPAGKDIPIGVAGPRQSVVIAVVVKSVTARTPGAQNQNPAVVLPQRGLPISLP